MLMIILLSFFESHAFFKQESQILENDYVVKQKAKLITAIKKKNNYFNDYFPKPIPSTHSPSTHNPRDRQIVGYLANDSFVNP